MRDPITDFEAIREFYITYLDTAFRVASPEIRAHRRHLLEEFGTLCAEPLLEPVPKYESNNIRIEDLADPGQTPDYLPGFNLREREIFVRLAAAGLLPATGHDDSGLPAGDFDLYTHQLEMLAKGVTSGQPGIVTSGTGSGKTEAFLLPVLATIAREAANHWGSDRELNHAPEWWKAADGAALSEEQFRERIKEAGPAGVFVHRRKHETPSRPAAVRALILYPMNALVEDQMVRLRRALDSDLAHSVMDQHLGGHRVYFARYTSATPVTGFLRHPRGWPRPSTRRPSSV